ncbi:hypothetical protein [Portibacter lacus]|uniref:Uncharacterized protein n=1 Tax=Portibacter lacus TaxID=1099794 RepID=A0AA37WGE9_9BACT|nr:hypothetical protein [Portibacter lacus]GLR19752.1 hypothetical protein GCM10007940_43680 [Portibacter lacus]
MFYKILNEFDSKIVGKNYPQIATMVKGYDYNKPDSVWHFRQNQVTPNLNYFQLEKSSKLTNVMSEGLIGGSTIFIDDLGYKIFSSFNFSEHQHYLAKLITTHYEPSVCLDCHVLVFPFHKFKNRSDLNLSESRFYIIDHNKGDLEIDINVKGATLEDLKDISILNENGILNLESGQNLRARKIFIRKEKAYDIFDIPILEMSGRYCNELVKKDIEESGITGIRFEEIPWLEYA